MEHFIDFIKFLFGKYKTSTVIVIILLIGINVGFSKWYGLFHVNELLSRILIQVLFSVLIISGELLRRWYISKPWLVTSLGALWNRYDLNNLEPFCVGCKLPLMPTSSGSNYYKCPNGHDVTFRDIDGNPANLETIRKRVREKLVEGMKTGKVK